MLLVPTFLKIEQSTLDLNKCVFVIKNYYATTSCKHVKERWEASKHMNVLKFKVDILNNCKYYNMFKKFVGFDIYFLLKFGSGYFRDTPCRINFTSSSKSNKLKNKSINNKVNVTKSMQRKIIFLKFMRNEKMICWIFDKNSTIGNTSNLYIFKKCMKITHKKIIGKFCLKLHIKTTQIIFSRAIDVQ